MNRFTRIKTFNPSLLKISYRAEVSVSMRIDSANALPPDGLENFSPEAIPFPFPSRYCQSDRLRQEAMNLFGHLTSPHAIAAG